MKDQELIWVDKDFAEKFNELTSKGAARKQQEEVFNEYMGKITDAVKREFRANLEGLEEDAAIFTGLMLKVRQAFEKAKSEHLNASYDLWEKFDAELPSIQGKTDKLIETLKPLEKQLTAINEALGKINTFNIERFTEALSRFLSLQNDHRQMIEFLINNFNTEKPLAERKAS